MSLDDARHNPWAVRELCDSILITSVASKTVFLFELLNRDAELHDLTRL